MKKNIKEWLSVWDEGNFDFTIEAMGELHKERPAETEIEAAETWKSRKKAAEKKETDIFNKIYPVMSVLLAFIMIIFFMTTVAYLPPFGSAETPANASGTIVRYIEDGLKETGAVNIVCGVILDYRAFDTLGESHVLFTATVAVFILLLLANEEKEPEMRARILRKDPILKNTAKILIPIVVLFGFYIMFNGHLGPGGGFSGGAVIGGGLILYSMAFGPENLQKFLNQRSYRVIVAAALLFYSLSKCYSFFCGANGMHTIFSPGTPGRIFSSGLILPLNLAVGVVVSCTMYGFYSIFTRRKI